VRQDVGTVDGSNERVSHEAPAERKVIEGIGWIVDVYYLNLQSPK
jgi:hypothetical protein